MLKKYILYFFLICILLSLPCNRALRFLFLRSFKTIYLKNSGRGAILKADCLLLFIPKVNFPWADVWFFFIEQRSISRYKIFLLFQFCKCTYHCQGPIFGLPSSFDALPLTNNHWQAWLLPDLWLPAIQVSHVLVAAFQIGWICYHLLQPWPGVSGPERGVHW